MLRSGRMGGCCCLLRSVADRRGWARKSLVKGLWEFVASELRVAMAPARGVGPLSQQECRAGGATGYSRPQAGGDPPWAVWRRGRQGPVGRITGSGPAGCCGSAGRRTHSWVRRFGSFRRPVQGAVRRSAVLRQRLGEVSRSACLAREAGCGSRSGRRCSAVGSMRRRASSPTVRLRLARAWLRDRLPRVAVAGFEWVRANGGCRLGHPDPLRSRSVARVLWPGDAGASEVVGSRNQPHRSYRLFRPKVWKFTKFRCYDSTGRSQEIALAQ